MTYDIVRLYHDEKACLRRRVVRKGLTLREAREWINHPESWSVTAQKAAGKARTRLLGAWIDTIRPEGRRGPGTR